MKVINARSILRAQFQAMHGAVVRAASDAAVVTVQVDAAVATVDTQIEAAISGDLITASPVLAAKITEIDGRLDALEP